MNCLLSVVLILLLGNTVGLVLWGMQTMDWYITSDAFKLVVAVTCISFLTFIWLCMRSVIKKETVLYITVFIGWSLSLAWVFCSIFLGIITNECVNILYNYYRYANGFNGTLTCSGEIVTTTFTVLLTFVWVIVAFKTSLLINKKEQVTVIERQPQMQEVNNRENTIEMENVPL
jgi:hypothetical protein